MMEYVLCILLVTFQFAAAAFEHGTHKSGDVKSFELKDTIPRFVPIHRINITHGRTDVEDHYTYLKVDTLTLAAQDPNIIFDSEHNMLTFFIRYPLYTISFLVIGYSMPLKDYTGIPDAESSTANYSETPLTLPTDLPELKYTYSSL